MKSSTIFEQSLRQRAIITFSFIALGFTIIIIRLFWIQVIDYSAYQKAAIKQHWKKQKLDARRGEIRDRSGNLLAISKVGYSLYCDPKMVKEPDKISQVIAPLIEKSVESVKRSLTHPKRRFVWLKRRLNRELKEKIRKYKFKGLHFQKEPKRVYPSGSLAAHILGFVGTDHRGLEGVEASFNEELSGADGYRWVAKDGRLAYSRIYTPEAPAVQPRDGANLYLTIDLRLQHALEDVLDRIMKKHTPKACAGVLLAAGSGEVLAMSSRPTYDPNNFGKYPRQNWRNIAISNAYELGSVMKPFVAAAGIAEGVVTKETVIFCHNGAYRMPGRILRDTHAYGDLKVADIIVKSSNIGTAIIGEKLGAERTYRYLTNVGFGKKTGISLSGEANGILKKPKRWTRFTLTSVPMGHEITVTTLQMAAAYTTIASGGVYWPPRVIDRLEYPTGEVAHRTPPQKLEQVYPKRVVNEMVGLLGEVVQRGTAKRAKRKLVAIGGKTGTAQKLVDGRYSRSKHIGVFAGIAPVPSPKFVCVIMVDEPKGGYYGGTVAAPSVADTLQKSVLYSKLSDY